MKKYLLLIFLGIGTLHSVNAQQHPLRERIYVSTDKECYICGETIWMSLFCFDLESGTPSNASAVAYIELQDLSQTFVKAKGALRNGRGSAVLSLPTILPTGTYSLTVYTRYQYQEDKSSTFRKIITIYNPYNSSRTQTTTVSDTLQTQIPSATDNAVFGSLTIQPSTNQVSTREPFTLTVSNNGANTSLTSVSVYKTETLNYFHNVSVSEYLQSLSKDHLNPITGKELVDYAGEILVGHLEKDQKTVTDAQFSSIRASIAIAGPNIQYYLGQISDEGKVHFYTSNLYGDGVLESQVISSVDTGIFQLVLDSSYTYNYPQNLPALYVNPIQQGELLQRSQDAQLMNAFNLDTLHHSLELSNNLLYADQGIEYKLDEYTRFPVMRDVIIEFVKEARWRTESNGDHVLQVRINDALGFPSFLQDLSRALVLVDGIPVTEHEKIYKYDPALIESITVYPHQYAYGYIYYSGLVFIKTYKGKAETLELGKSIRLQDFQGVQSPKSFFTGVLDDRLPDRRHTLYWNPLVTLESGESTQLEIRSGDCTGEYVIVVEGMSADGQPLRNVSHISVK